MMREFDTVESLWFKEYATAWGSIIAFLVASNACRVLSAIATASTRSFRHVDLAKTLRTIDLPSISPFRISMHKTATPQGDSMTDYRVTPGDVQEDQVTAAIEMVTARVPSSIYLAAALTSMAVSLSFKIVKKNDTALFVGQWAAPFLILGMYNKLVKLHGSDGTTHS